MGAYAKLLDDKITNTSNTKIGEQLILYRDFIKDLIKGEGLLDKKVYIVIPFSQLELGPAGVSTGANPKKMSLNERVKSALVSKRTAVLSQVERMGLTSRPLSTDELVKLFYELFNQEFVTLDFNSTDIKNVVL